MSNYIPDINKFKLAGPPSWWLTKLREFDDSLVVIPSRQGFYYRLAQRRKLNLSEEMVKDALFAESDTKMMAEYGLVPVTTILSTANWSNPELFVELANRSVHRQGGHEAVNAMLDARERQDEIDINIRNSEMLDSVSKDAWKLYQKKIGVRSHMWSPTVRPANPGGLKANRSTSLVVR
jgi:hypothetical protein